MIVLIAIAAIWISMLVLLASLCLTARLADGASIVLQEDEAPLPSEELIATEDEDAWLVAA
jgi:hypothetical protein